MLIPLDILRAACAFGLFATMSVAVEPSTQPASRKAASWTSITYPGLKVPSLQGDELVLTIQPQTQTTLLGYVGPGLRFKFQWLPRESDTKAFKERIKVRLHYPDGRVLEPSHELPPLVISSGALVAIRSYFFPYSDNFLTESWLEVRIDQNTYWFEIPYGFTRDPAAPLPPSNPMAAPAGFSPAMKDSPKDAVSVRWSAIRYDFGKVQNGWDLKVDLTHTGPLGCIVRLERSDGPWNFHSPVIKVSVEKDNGGTIPAEQITERLPDAPPYLREDEFAFKLEPLAGRGWGNLIITIDDQRWSGVISLGPFLEGIWIEPWTH